MENKLQSYQIDFYNQTNYFKYTFTRLNVA